MCVLDIDVDINMSLKLEFKGDIRVMSSFEMCRCNDI